MEKRESDVTLPLGITKQPDSCKIENRNLLNREQRNKKVNFTLTVILMKMSPGSHRSAERYKIDKDIVSQAISCFSLFVNRKLDMKKERKQDSYF